MWTLHVADEKYLLKLCCRYLSMVKLKKYIFQQQTNVNNINYTFN